MLIVALLPLQNSHHSFFYACLLSNAQEYFMSHTTAVSTIVEGKRREPFAGCCHTFPRMAVEEERRNTKYSVANNTKNFCIKIRLMVCKSRYLSFDLAWVGLTSYHPYTFWNCFKPWFGRSNTVKCIITELEIHRFCDVYLWYKREIIAVVDVGLSLIT